MRGAFEKTIVVLTDSKGRLFAYLLLTSLYDPPLLRLLNFQVNTRVDLFWIMLKTSTCWLVVYFAPPQFLFTQSTSSLFKLYTLHIVAASLNVHHFLYVIDPLYRNNNDELQSFRIRFAIIVALS